MHIRSFFLLLFAVCCWDSHRALECGHTLFLKQAALPRYQSAHCTPWSVRCGSVRDQAGGKKMHVATKNPNHLPRSGKCIGKGSEKTTFNSVASPIAPWSGSRLTPLLGSGWISASSLSTLTSLQHVLITSINYCQLLLSPVHGLALWASPKLAPQRS